MKNDEYSEILYTDEEVEDRLLDAIIFAGCHEYVKNMNTTITDEEKAAITFSDEHRLNMKRFFNDLDKKDTKDDRKKVFAQVKSFAMKVSAFIVFLLILSIVTVTTSEAARIRFLNVYVDVFDIKTDFSFMENTGLPENNIYHMLGYVPDGFRIAENNDENTQNLLLLEYDEYYIYIEGFEIVDITIDTEYAETSEKQVGNYHCFIAFKDDRYTYIIYDDTHGYMLSSNYHKEELEKIIENMK